ncbi:MAG TPA: hypothetical protein VLJ10_02365, partial [Candidatus Bathyarchaeia archaeon]|nr:hypothetical protein [Candidatus Bathyarchaeia archaeon]
MKHLVFSLACLLSVMGSLSSCAGLPAMQQRVRRLSAQGDFNDAGRLLDRTSFGIYGRRNRLIEAMDRGLVFYYAGQYEKSIAQFEQAKQIYDELYTESISKIAASWLWNDLALPYPGEDFERAMINVFQALNFLALGRTDEALVEARNVDSVLKVMNDRYPSDQKNVYREDAFARLLMGIIYECADQPQDLNDAFISYQKSFQVYEKDFTPQYSVTPPVMLRENLLSLAAWMGERQGSEYRRRFPDTAFLSVDERRKSAEVYVIYHRGQIVNKVQSSIVLPGMDGLLTRISFPQYRHDFRGRNKISITVVGNDKQEHAIDLELAQDLDAIARQNLENRKVRIMAKAVARPLTKQLMAEAAEDVVRDK